MVSAVSRPASRGPRAPAAVDAMPSAIADATAAAARYDFMNFETAATLLVFRDARAV